MVNLKRAWQENKLFFCLVFSSISHDFVSKPFTVYISKPTLGNSSETVILYYNLHFAGTDYINNNASQLNQFALYKLGISSGLVDYLHFCMLINAH